MFKCIGPLTLFMTLSADDLHWAELGMLLHEVDFQGAQQRKSVTEYMRKDPLMTTIHFERRFDALIKHVILSGPEPLGKGLDLFARVKFQNRGSPHIHMFFFLIRDVPNEINENSVPDLLHYIKETIKSTIPNVADMELHNLFKKLQAHSHRSYCTKAFKTKCRFGFPKEKCSRTRIFGNKFFRTK